MLLQCFNPAAATWRRQRVITHEHAQTHRTDTANREMLDDVHASGTLDADDNTKQCTHHTLYVILSSTHRKRETGKGGGEKKKNNGWERGGSGRERARARETDGEAVRERRETWT
jgi:hypothetical protein